MISKMFAVTLLCFAFLIATCIGMDRGAEIQSTRRINIDSKPATDHNPDLHESSNESRNKKEIDYYAHFKPEHREVLQAWLETKSYLRPGVEEIDNKMFEEKDTTVRNGNLEFLRSTVGENGYQYYSVGDMNHDGQEDFAVLLVDSRWREDDGFALAIFNAPLKTGNAPAYFEDELTDMSNSYIVFDKMSKTYLFLGKFESDVYCDTYYPKGETYYFKNCLD